MGRAMSGGGQPRSWPSDADVRRAAKRAEARGKRLFGDWTEQDGEDFMRAVREASPDHWARLYQQEPTPPTDAEVWESIKRGRCRPACLCPRETIRRVLIERGTCGGGGCPYGGDF